MKKKKTNNSTKISIDRDVPLPENRRRKYPFSDMKVGDSILYSEDRSRITQIRAYNAANLWAKRNHPGWKFATRATEAGIRIWRIT